MLNKKMRVVLIDDSLPFCEAMRFYFDTIDEIELIIFNDAIHFLKNFGHYNSKDILLMDLLMPGMDGIMLLSELKKRNNQLYTIVISGHADKKTANQVKLMGANEFLSKPFNVDRLVSKILSLK